MNILIFIVILVILILVHEFGHFLVAKKFKIRVDEFGLGYPPRVATLFRKGETQYTLNAIPFGGFVKIFGENPDDVPKLQDNMEQSRSFQYKNKWIQAAVLAAGVTFNVVFAWILISAGFMWGLPTPADYGAQGNVTDAKLVVTDVRKDSPAEKTGLQAGDVIVGMMAGKETLTDVRPEATSRFIASHGDDEIVVSYKRGNEAFTLFVRPEEGIATGKKVIGISMDMIGILKLAPHLALWEGAKVTGGLLWETAKGLAAFLGNAIIGRGDFTQVAGPVGIVGLVGNVSDLGFVYLISFTAFISINLAIINLIPFPALDGGRLLFVAIEAVKGSRINPKIANGLNTIGFALLILLMIIVTFNDIVKLL